MNKAVNSTNKEIEIKLFIPSEALPKSILADAPAKQFTQWYYPLSNLATFIETLQSHGIEIDPDEELHQPRLRKVEDSTGVTFFLTLKGPKQKDFSRVEYEVEINERVFLKLSQIQSSGWVKKSRSYLNALLQIPEQEQVNRTTGQEITVEIDQVIDTQVFTANIENKAELLDTFFLVDIEFQSTEHVRYFLDGLHDADYLKTAIVVSEQKSSIRKPLKMTYLACSGVDQGVKDAVIKLTELYDARVA